MGVDNGFSEITPERIRYTNEEDGIYSAADEPLAMRTADSWLSRLPWCVAGMALALVFMVPLHLSRGNTPAADTRRGDFINDPPRTVVGTTPGSTPAATTAGTTRFAALESRNDFLRGMNPQPTGDDHEFKKVFDTGETYTVYYISGCWPTSLAPDANYRYHQQPGPCEDGDFEIAVAEINAFSGNVMRARNLTDLHFRRLDAVKLTPDEKYVVLVASLANDIGNLYVTGAGEANTQMVFPLLAEEQLDALDAQCSFHSRAILQEAKRESSGQRARLAGYKQLQVVTPTTDGQPGSRYTHYRAAFAFECAEPGNPINRPVQGIGWKPLRFTKLAIVEFRLPGDGHLAQHSFHSELHVIQPEIPRKQLPWISRWVQYSSQCCPRFVPSRGGHALLFIAEDVVISQHVAMNKGPGAHIKTQHLALVDVDPGANYSAGGKPRQMCCRALTAECLACSQDVTVETFCAKLRGAHFPGCEQVSTACCKEKNAVCLACEEGKSVEQFCHEQGKNLDIPGCEEDAASAADDNVLRFRALEVKATLVGGLPPLRFLGCPEFIADLGIDNFGNAAISRPKTAVVSERQGDTFAVMSDTTSLGVTIGITAQGIAVTLPKGNWTPTPSGRLLVVPKAKYGAELLFNNDGTRLSGCKPVKGATPAVAELRMMCVDDEQRLVVLESRDQEDWMHVNMPVPPSSQPRATKSLARLGPWCPKEREDACFEAWMRHD